jgi:hypothetical protein
MRRFMQWRRGDAVLLGEANVLPEETEEYLTEDDGLASHVQLLCKSALVLCISYGRYRIIDYSA